MITEAEGSISSTRQRILTAALERIAAIDSFNARLEPTPPGDLRADSLERSDRDA